MRPIPTPLQQAAWIGLMWAAVALICIGVTFLVLSLPADAMTLQISGHSAGTGYQNLSFAGDILNISLLQNLSGISWNITGAM